MGIGKSGEIIDIKKLKVKIGNFVVAENGKVSENYDEKKLKEYMEWDSVEVEITLKMGNGAFKCYTCDFTTTILISTQTTGIKKNDKI